MTPMRARTLATSLVVALAGAGCGGGGDSAPPNCLQVQPCGGNVVGTWSLLGVCFSERYRMKASDSLAAVCPGASIDTFDIDVSGTITFNADLTYVSNVHETVSATERIPLSCLGGFASCAEVTSSSPESTLTCTGTTMCTCHASGMPTGDETGTYATSGTSLSMTDPNSTSTDAYCVEQNRLHVIGIDDTTGEILGDFVGQKQ